VKANLRIWLVAIAVILTGLMAFVSATSPDSSASLASDPSKDVLFQVSAITALMQGVFEGSMSFKELAMHGDFGIGTLDDLDGELVELDGQFYQVKADGKVYPVSDSQEAPIADVTFFEPDQKILFNGSANQTELQRYLEDQMPSKNIFYAIRIDGTFDYIKTRSPPAQDRPYPTLTEALGHQSVFELYNQSGTIVGFWSPAYANGVIVPGYHFHFLNENRTAGGHVLDFSLKNASIAIDYTPEFFMVLPENKEFLQADLTGADQAELQKAEGNPGKGK
jgi:acetolactate decarboxylase